MGQDVEPGMVLREKYRVDRVIGRGGMARVLEAWHMDLDRRVAIKVLLPALREQREIVERFLREARAAARLESAYVARILDVDRLPDGTPFIVMEYLDGEDLSAFRRTKRPAAIGAAVEYVIQACEALQEAHTRGIVHRDVKPANLFLARSSDGSERIKVVDFGISKMTAVGGSSPSGGNFAEPSMTHTSMVMGSAEYMSPEQMLSTRDVDGRTDIWALGTVLYEILTARPPFVGETLPQVCACVLGQQVARPRTFRPEIPEALEQIILRCLEKEREKRYATAKDLGAALRGCLTPSPAQISPTAARMSSAGLGAPLGLEEEPTELLAIPSPPVAASPPRVSPPSDPPPAAAVSALTLGAQTPPHDTTATPGGAGSMTATPYSRDYAPPQRPRRVGWILVAIGGLAGLGVGVTVALQSTRDTAASSPSARPDMRTEAPSALPQRPEIAPAGPGNSIGSAASGERLAAPASAVSSTPDLQVSAPSVGAATPLPNVKAPKASAAPPLARPTARPTAKAVVPTSGID